MLSRSVATRIASVPRPELLYKLDEQGRTRNEKLTLVGPPSVPLLMISASFAMTIPVPEPSSRITKGFGAPSMASRSGRGVGSEEPKQSFSSRLRFESPGSDERVDCLCAEKGLGGSNSIPGSPDSK